MCHVELCNILTYECFNTMFCFYESHSVGYFRYKMKILVVFFQSTVLSSPHTRHGGFNFVMTYAHGPVFCPIQLQVRENCLFFVKLFLRTRSDFYRIQKYGPSYNFFYRGFIWRTRFDFFRTYFAVTYW